MLSLSDIEIYSDGSVGISKMPLIYNRLGIIRKLSDYMADPRPIEVNAVAYQDADVPVSVTKGHTIPVLPTMQEYLKKIQSKEAYQWVVQPRMLWINRDDWAAECIGAGYGNFIEIIGEVTTSAGTFYEIRAFEYDDPMKFKPHLTWRNRPTLFGKCTARKQDGTILNVGSGLDCYFPNMKRTSHLWVSAEDVELFPPLPQGIWNYALQGASVYGWNGERFIPLRIAEFPGQLEHPTPWRLNTGSVIPPV